MKEDNKAKQLKEWKKPQLIELDAESAKNTSASGIHTDGGHYAATSTLLS